MEEHGAHYNSNPYDFLICPDGQEFSQLTSAELIEGWRKDLAQKLSRYGCRRFYELVFFSRLQAARDRLWSTPTHASPE
jgi:hypothetical protein